MINFPDNPTNGQTFTTNGITYVYSNTKNVWATSPPFPVVDLTPANNWSNTLFSSLTTITSAATDYNVAATDYIIKCNPSGNNMNVLLPNAQVVGNKTYVIKHFGNLGNTVNVQSFSATQPMDDLTYFILNQYDALTLVSNSNVWIII